MARPALIALDTLELLGVDSLLYVSDSAGEHPDDRAEDGRDNGLDDASANANGDALGLQIAATAPEGTPVAPDHPDDAGGPDLVGMSGIALFDPVFAAKGGNKPDGGGGGGGGNKGGGGGGGDPSLMKDYISGGDAATSFNVEIIFKGTWTQALQQAFVDAADYLSTIITADIADVFFRGKVIDDIRIDATLTDIDGAGGILGQAGPTAYRTADFLPATAIMEFDIADAEVFDGMGLFDDIVLHEMLHSIGFGTMWEMMGLTEGSIAAQNLVFTGANAERAYADIYNGTGAVPVEDDTGYAGTDGGHWDEETFGNELMTGFIDSPNTLSMMTVAALEDMGYETIYELGMTNAEMPDFSGSLLIG